MTDTTYLDRWLEDPKGGKEWRSAARHLKDHDRSCTSLPHAWMPRTGGVSDAFTLTDCEGCGLPMHPEGTEFLELDGEAMELCGCCRKARLHDYGLLNLAVKENIVSERYWWEEHGRFSHWWRLLYVGRDENCNLILSARLPGGIANLSLMYRIRQKPCSTCQGIDAWEAFKHSRSRGATV